MPLSLDDLAAASYATLAADYATGTIPADRLEALDGAVTGRLLAVRGLGRGPLVCVQKALRRMAAAPAFPWEGKSFQPEGPEHGTGINRVSVPALLGRQNVFPFVTGIGPSEVDGRPALRFDYDLPENPPYIRRLHDEVRQVAPGIFFGPAMWKRAGGATLLFWFGLDAGFGGRDGA